MKKKGIVSLLACGVIAAGATLGLTACSGNNGITVWASQAEQATLKEMIEIFRSENPDFKTPITTGVVGTDMALSKISVDVEVCADIYCFANDQIVDLNNYGGLSALSPAGVTKIKADNDEQSVEAGRIGDKYYGYPYSADNGYYLYYNKNIMTEEEAGSLEGILAACKKSGKYFIYNMTEAWYVGAFFLGTAEGCVGGTYTYEYEGPVIKTAYTNFSDKVAGTEYSIGQVGGMAMIELNKNKMFVSGGDKEISQYLLGDGTETKFGACISGTWNAEAIQTALGDGYAATKLPTFHSSLTDKDYQMGSLMGYKLLGVNPKSKHLDEAHQLAAFLTSERMQDLRFDRLQTGPSNKVVAAKDKIKENVALNALIEQMPYATAQGAFSQKYWNAMKTFGASVYSTGSATATIHDKATLDAGLGTFYEEFVEG